MLNLTETMTPAENGLLLAEARNAGFWLEWGSGLSTVKVLKENAFKIDFAMTTVEGSADFAEDWLLQQPEVIEAVALKELLVLQRDSMGTTWRSNPDPAFHAAGEAYSRGAVEEMLRTRRLESVLVDGRFRVACAATAFIHGAERVLIHDFFNRPFYHVLAEIYEVAAHTDTMALLLPPQDLEEKERRLNRALDIALAHYKDPR